MQLQINGEPREFPDRLNLAALIAHLGMKADRVAVELNLEIVPRANWETTQLKDGDKLEIVHFVGGGSGANDTAETEAPVSASSVATWNCPSCGTETLGKYCSACGEKKSSHADLSVHHFFSHAMEVLFHADSRISRSFRVLFFQPGLLSSEYVRGCRKPYFHPFQVFFVANFIYFLLQPLTHWTGLKVPLQVHTQVMFYRSLASQLLAQRLAAKGVPYADFARSFDHVIDLHARSLVVLMVPIFALLLWPLEWRRRRLFGEHLVFAFHFYAFWLITMFLVLFGLTTPALSALAHWGIVFRKSRLDFGLYVAGQAIVAAYLFFAIRTFYGDKFFMAAVKALVLTALTYYIMQLYRFVLLLTALYSS